MKTYEVWKRINQWEVSTVKANDWDEAHDKWSDGKVDSVRTEIAEENDGEYEIEEMEE